MIERADIGCGFPELRHGRTRILLRHDQALRRIVIHKDHRFRQDPQLCGDLSEITALGLPVGADADKILRPQDSVRMVQSRERILRIVLGIHRQHHAQIPVRAHIPLKRMVQLAQAGLLPDLETIRPVISHDTAP